MAIIEQRVDLTGKGGIYIKASNGKTVTITPVEILARYATDISVNKIGNTTDWVCQTIEDALGEGMVSKDQITHTFDPLTGKPVKLEIRNF